MFKPITTHKNILADTLTPVGIYMRLRDKYPGSILLESNEYGSRSNSYSFICCNPVASLNIDQNFISMSYPDGSSHEQEFDLSYDLARGLEKFKDQFYRDDNEFSFPTNGLFGYLTYDAVQLFENIKFDPSKIETDAIPMVNYQVFQNVLVFDHYHNQLYVFDHAYNGADSKMESLVDTIEHRDIARYSFNTTQAEQSEMQDQDFKNLVAKGKQHCQRGDVFQIVVSRKFSQSYKGDDFNVYRQLRAINPSPYLFYFDYGNFRIFGSSPEAQILINDDTASIQPIAGTYKRTGDDAADLQAANDLKKDPKEAAEHIMLVDLARNDLSRHARDVQVTDYQNIHFYSHVIHMVSTVTGKVAQEDRMDLIGDTFPAGTLSGAPKYRAMQLIDGLEKSARQFYGGAIGYLGFDGSLNHAIIIRTILSQNNTMFYRAGAGVVVDSNLDSENQEVYNKTNALRKAIEQANETV
ncbi:anthranilate synthase component I family protein [Nonlabens ponticola]|uniref:Anthranilate synthase component 1 n=1 Tax=Nonlabens ponticola TaxID=2496866 RepID=A0A3S9N0U8_9FLAO|nr:anthranilate synthase component I family protein [Nonlabens ponticola]AZQ45050.1 anthranilate synthase component I family protein [Nonlabens ponticola]